MTYLDIFAESVSHFTNIETNFIKVHFQKFVCANECNAKLVRDVMWKKIPDDYAEELIEKLKSGDFTEAMNFFINCFDLYKKEIVRQSVMN